MTETASSDPETSDTGTAEAPDTSQCPFCRMVTGEIQADEVHRTSSVLAFRDISPQAPTHVLVVPTQHHRDVGALVASDPGVLVEMVRVAASIGEQECPGGWRWVINSGPDSGRSVFHVHGHVLGGRSMAWPPG